MRYFYTDALAAAWMAKHYGMRFNEANEGFERIIGEYSDYNGEYTEPRAENKYYIHPDSLHLLEPLEGDKDEDGFHYSSNTKWWLKSLTDHKGREHVFNKGSVSKPATRNGVAFMWPESEAA